MTLLLTYLCEVFCLITYLFIQPPSFPRSEISNLCLMESICLTKLFSKISLFERKASLSRMSHRRHCNVVWKRRLMIYSQSSSLLYHQYDAVKQRLFTSRWARYLCLAMTAMMDFSAWQKVISMSLSHVPSTYDASHKNQSISEYGRNNVTVQCFL